LAPESKSGKIQMGKNSSENVKQIKGIIEFYLLCNEE
jgi:hypothetical protein